MNGEDGWVPNEPTDEQPRAYPMTDVGNAARFVDLHGADLRWCGSMPGTGWMVWTGSRWESDDTKRVNRLGASLGAVWRREANLIDDDKKHREAMGHVKHTEAAQGIRGLVEIAQAHEAIVTRPAQWDADLWAFNTPSVTYDLKRQTAHRPRREEYITRIGNVDASSADDCPIWKAFLDTIFAGDDELIGYIRRAMGYCLTGSTAEQCVFICYGTGQNGKSKFIEVLHHILGDYAKQTPVQTFTQKREGGIPNDLAALNGARVVTCSEAKEGEGLDEALVKLASGGDPISARFLNREFFSFLPAFKLWMLTNHKPVIKGTDKGIWRRIRLIPFLVTIPEDKVDKDLGTKLKGEAAAILRWTLDGLKDYRAVGLSPPAAVTAATDEYREDMDSLAEFIEDCIDRVEGGEEDNQAVYDAYKAWATSHGERNPRSHRSLSKELKARRFTQKTDRSEGRRWEGMTLKARPQDQQSMNGWSDRTRSHGRYGDE
jgi:putative DNA primase/helicase